MKRTRICPKCQSNEIYRVPAVVGEGYGSGNVIPTGIIGVIKVHRYVCGRCGYVEQWIDESDLSKLKKKFQRI